MKFASSILSEEYLVDSSIHQTNYLLQESGKFDIVSHSTTLPEVQAPNDFVTFKPSKHALRWIIELLKNDKVNMVGLYGMGGVGKTTLARVVGNRVKEEKLFDEVVMVTVTQNPNFKNIQSQIADSLGLDLKEETIETRAQRLCLILKNEKTILIILDDVWAILDLTTIGIPFGSDHKGCKIFLTARLKQVCIDMRCQSQIQLDILNEEEGLILFRKQAGTSAEGSNASLFELSTLYRLSRLSLSIKVHQYLPKDFILSSKLQRYNIRVNDDDHKRYRFPYDSYPKSRLLTIRSMEVTSLLAFKALYKKVEYLELRKIVGCCQNIVPGIDETGLNELKSLSLESLDELKCIIDMRQQQDVPSNAFSNLVDLLVNSVGLREVCSGGRPPRGFLDNLETLKIQNCNRLICLFPRMLILRLQKLKKVTVENCGELEDVFQLEALCYAKENSFLPSSLASSNSIWLKNMRYICKGPTQQVSLKGLTIVQVYRCNKLKYLFTLSVARSLLQSEELTVRDCGSLEHIVAIKAEENRDGNYVVLPKLRKLHIAGIEKFINFCSENYYSIGRAPQELLLYSPLNSDPSFVAEVENNVSQTSNEKLRVLDQWCNTVLAQLRHGLYNLEELKIRGCVVQVLFQLEGLKQELSLPKLKVIELEYLPELECLYKGGSVTEVIEVEYLPEQKRLCKVPKHLLSMQNLKRLAVNDCYRLRYMFSDTLAQNLMQLEELIIRRCGELEQILVEDGDDDKTLLRDYHQKPRLFPNLSRVDISYCTQLKSMFPDNITHLLSLQNLTTLELDNCHRLTHLFSSALTQNLLQLERIDIEDCGELEQIIVKDHTRDQGQLGLFPNLSYISVKRCGKLKTLFNVTIARRGLKKLRNLYIQTAFQLEVLFGHKDEAGMTGDREIVLPLLEVLTLRELASLVNFCPSDCHFRFPSLSHLWVTECPKIITRFSVDQNRSVHAEAEEDVAMKQSPPETTVEIYCQDFDALRKRLPTYIIK
ncbi:hypothetical protein Ddye_011989 [Dipteronia dyeriana]|uniref:AAA+ ATPase domain-containing protein n=1 Tax=Dipteronia dyeriana TaxID=168575 RepID=A0AAD9X3P5_9ROSI|nr:hypothetical protein Ddye_011989 [Dipteronia dyeriana]